MKVSFLYKCRLCGKTFHTAPKETCTKPVFSLMNKLSDSLSVCECDNGVDVGIADCLGIVVLEK